MIIYNNIIVMTSLSRNGYSIKKKNFKEEDILKIKNELTVSVENRMFEFLEPKTYSLYSENDNKLYLPKYYGLQKFGIPERNVIGTGEKRENMTFVGQIRDEQLIQINAFMDTINDPLKMGGIISIGCGGGKSVIAIYIACLLKLKTLFISHKDFLNVQFSERIKMFSPNSKIGKIKQNIIDIEDKDFVVASLQSIAMKDYPNKIFNDFGLVIIDECHHTSAQVFSQALIKTCSPYTLGLSATLNRKDGLRKVFEWFIGKCIIKPIFKTDDNNVLVKTFKFNNNTLEYCQTLTNKFNNKINTVGMLTQICSFKPRTEFISNIIFENMEKNRKLIILSERKELLKELYELLKNNIYSIGYYIGGMKQNKLDESSTKDIILATFQLAQEGLDIPSLNMLLFATPISDIEQSVGRILREKPENRIHIPLIIDIIDDFSIFKNRFNKRLNFYKKKNYIIKNE